MTLPDFEAWMAKMVHYIYYSDGWFWWVYREEFGTWPSPEMKARGIEMRKEYLRAAQATQAAPPPR